MPSCVDVWAEPGSQVPSPTAPQLLPLLTAPGPLAPLHPPSQSWVDILIPSRLFSFPSVPLPSPVFVSSVAALASFLGSLKIHPPTSLILPGQGRGLGSECILPDSLSSTFSSKLSFSGFHNTQGFRFSFCFPVACPWPICWPFLHPRHGLFGHQFSFCEPLSLTIPFQTHLSRKIWNSHVYP